MEVLKNHVVAITGVRSSDIPACVKKITDLGGIYSEALYRRTTVLLVKVVGSNKYVVAKDLAVPTLKLQWLDDCHSSSSLKPLGDYIVPCFTGLTFSTTGFKPDDRTSILKQISDNGGEIHSALSTKTSHLVALTADGEKYKHAIAWKLKIVSWHWVEDCIGQQRWISEEKYAVEPKSVKDQSSEPINLRISGIMPAGAAVSTQNTQIQLRLDQLPSLEDLEMRTVGWTRPVFQGDIFFVSGFDPDIRDYIVRAIVIGGGHRHHVLTTSVTKIILGPHVHPALLAEASNHPCGADCIHMSWLVHMLGIEQEADGKQPNCGDVAEENRLRVPQGQIQAQRQERGQQGQSQRQDYQSTCEAKEENQSIHGDGIGDDASDDVAGSDDGKNIPKCTSHPPQQQSQQEDNCDDFLAHFDTSPRSASAAGELIGAAAGGSGGAAGGGGGRRGDSRKRGSRDGAFGGSFGVHNQFTKASTRPPVPSFDDSTKGKMQRRQYAGPVGSSSSSSSASSWVGPNSGTATGAAGAGTGAGAGAGAIGVVYESGASLRVASSGSRHRSHFDSEESQLVYFETSE